MDITTTTPPATASTAPDRATVIARAREAGRIAHFILSLLAVVGAAAAVIVPIWRLS